ncbi:MAG: DUF4823 domain-containing protein [Azoarcus sp.]|jgi:hypothetical protein|nr:DUF4823 domain-containing protein [Azoarcus sp.]
MKKWLILALPAVFVALTMSGCGGGTQFKVNDAPDAASAPNERLERDQAIYIAVPQDGAYKKKVYEGSGMQAASALHGGLAQFASPITVGDQYEDQATALQSAKAKKARYVFVPVITNWVHRIAALSGRASGVSMTVSVFDLTRESGSQLVVQKNLRVKGRNSLAAQRPEELLKMLCFQFAEEIYLGKKAQEESADQ